MKKVQVNMGVMLGMLHLAGKQDVRYYINGIFIDTGESGFTRYIATDGHVLGVYREKRNQAEFPDATKVIISREDLKLFKMDKYLTHGILTIHDAEIVNEVVKPRKCVLEYAGVTLQFNELEGKFPEYLRVLPITFSGEPAQFNPALIDLFVRFGKQILGSKKDVIPTIAYNGESTSGVTISGISGFFGAIMPVKADTVTVPNWLIKEVAETAIQSAKQSIENLNPLLADRLPEYEEKIRQHEEILAKLNEEAEVTA